MEKIFLKISTFFFLATTEFGKVPAVITVENYHIYVTPYTNIIRNWSCYKSALDSLCIYDGMMRY